MLLIFEFDISSVCAQEEIFLVTNSKRLCVEEKSNGGPMVVSIRGSNSSYNCRASIKDEEKKS
jgi:hypothetical protein